MFGEMYYDRSGTPINEWEYIRLRSNFDYCVVEKTDLVVGTTEADAVSVEVSTVWLGLNHNFIPAGPPLIFETMIFGGEFDEYMWRYTTEEEAREGHQAVVDMLKAIAKGAPDGVVGNAEGTDLPGSGSS